MPTSLRDAAAATQIVEKLREAIPDVQISTDAHELEGKSRDRWPEAAKWSASELAERLPVAVVRPANAREVSSAILAAAEVGVSVMPYGAGSGVVGGVVSGIPHIALDTSRLTEVSFDDERGEVTAGAGVLGVDLENALSARGRRVPHYPQSLSLASVGGLVATRSSGTFSSKYGNIEDLLVSLEVVLADGSIVTTRSVPRASTGPSIAQLFVGSEGTLGVITSVTLRTLPQALVTAFRGVAFAELGDGLRAVRNIVDAGITPAVIRLYDAGEAVHLFERSGIEPLGRALLILAFDGHGDVVAAEQAIALELSAALGGDDLGATPGDTWERTRFDASWLDRGNAGDTNFADAIEVSASWPVLEKVHDEVLAQLGSDVDLAYAHYSHFYPNGAAIYFILFTSGEDRDEALARYRRAWQTAVSIVHAHGGSMGHHHGVGEARKAWMSAEHDGALEVLVALKAALDPHNLLAPGKLGLGATEAAL